jgi:type IV pilus assembly protein PilQ
MKKGIFLLLLLANSIFGAQLNQINFYQTGEVSQIELVFDGEDIKASKFQLAGDKQLIIDLKDVTATDRVMRAFDTSEFSGSVVFVSAYKKKNSENDLRIAVQLRDNVRSILDRRGNRIVLNVENRFGVFTQAEIDQEKPLQDIVNDKNIGNYNVPKSESVEDILENLTMSGKKKYVGKRISINVKDVTVEDVLKMIADASGFNIIITDEIKKLPPLSLSLTNVPWDQALDTILEINKLVASKNGGILTVVTLDKATRDKQAEIAANKLIKEEEPLVTKVFPISFGEIDKLKTIITDYLTPKRGSVSTDERTNYLIVKDTVDTIEKIKKIIETLDTATPQVLIEAKIVDVKENSTKLIGLEKGINFGYDPIGQQGTATTTIGGETLGTNSGPGFTFNSAAVGGSFFGLNVKTFGRVFDLAFNLQLLEQESKAKIISNPKVITQNKKTANIKSSDTLYYLEQGQTDGGGTSSSWKSVNTNLSLDVTPQITNDGSISLDVKVTKSEAGARADRTTPPEIFSRDVSTKVLVDNGSTVVIGGIYKQSNSESESGVPFLKDLPLLGWLFRSAYNPISEKSELIIFLTPRIINQDESGLGDKF